MTDRSGTPRTNASKLAEIEVFRVRFLSAGEFRTIAEEFLNLERELALAQAELAAARKALDNVGVLARRLTYALARSHTNDELCKQSVDFLKRIGLGGKIVRTL